MADHDNGATVRLAATIARSRHEADGGTMLDGIRPDTIVEMALAAKREVDSLRTELAEARAALGTAKHQRDEWMRFCDKVERELAEARESASKYHAELVDSLRVVADERDTARQERDAAIRERDARVPLGTLPIEFVAGEWILSGQDEPDAVVTYASEPSPETGHVGWCWWARGKMGEARDYVAAREAAEKSIRAHAAGSGKVGDDG